MHLSDWRSVNTGKQSVKVRHNLDPIKGFGSYNYSHMQFRAMGSPCQLFFYHPSALSCLDICREVLGRIDQLEQRYSRFLGDSVLSKINQAAGTSRSIELDDELFQLLSYADQAYEQSDALFDITAGVLYRVWDFKQKRVPSQHEIEQCLPLVGWRQVEWRNGAIRLPKPGMALDLGGIVKEYAVDVAANVLRQFDIQSGLVDMGGDIQVMGPHISGKPWQVAVNDPWQPGHALFKLDVTSGAVATSGLYERYIDHQGQRFAHILNPNTGWPVQGLVATTICAPQCLVAGTATTIALLKPPKAAKDWVASMGVPYWCMSNERKIQTNMIDVPVQGSDKLCI